MILEQHYLGCLSQASYLIADEESGAALVVDPRRDVELYLERAAALGVRVEHVLLTHFHADFLAGHLELSRRTGATIHLGAAASAEFDFHPLADGDELSLGSVRVVALETPGHTPESVSYLVHDARRDPERPHAVLTGDTLFLGDVGRPDLMASQGVTAQELAGRLYDSLREKLLPLPDETLVYPGHGAGSACGKNLSTDTVSTVGDQRATNYALQPMTREEFIAIVTRDQPLAPAYFSRAAGLNRRPHADLGDVLAEALRPRALEEALAEQRSGATLLDVRDRDRFAAGHVPGSVWIGLDGRFASWAGTLLDLDAPIVLVAEPGDEREAALRLGRIGLDRVRGYLRDPAGALAEAGERVARLGRAGVDDAASELAGDAPPLVLDVRRPGEVANARLVGSLPIPLAELERRADEVPADRRVLVHCKSGYRSVTAASLLLRAGFPAERLIDVAGGIDAWIEAGHPVAVAGCAAEPA